MQIWPTVIPSMRRASTEWLGQWRATASSPEGGGSGIPKASFEYGEGNSGGHYPRLDEGRRWVVKAGNGEVAQKKVHRSGGKGSGWPEKLIL
jgi:hypothetical protein